MALDPFACGAGFAVTAQPERPAVLQKPPRQQRWRGGSAAICLLCCKAAARPTPNRISPVLAVFCRAALGAWFPLAMLPRLGVTLFGVWNAVLPVAGGIPLSPTCGRHR